MAVKLHCSEELPDHSCALFLASLSFQVNDAGLRKVVDLPTPLPKSITPIQILTVHEKLFVEESYIINRPRSHHHESAIDRFNFVDVIFVKVGEIVSRTNAR